MRIFYEIKDSHSQDKVNILAQLRPVNGSILLPQNIKLILISRTGKILQEVASRVQDNCIQLNVFKGKPGKKFSIQVMLENSSITEQFEI